VISAESDDRFRSVQCAIGVAAKNFKQGLELINLCRGRGMARFGRSRDSLVDQRACPSDLTELLIRVSEIGCRASTRIHAKAEFGLAIKLRIIELQGLNEIHLGPDEIALPQAGQT
jgi:hypothetical protein